MNSNVLRCCNNYLCTNFDSTIVSDLMIILVIPVTKIILNLILVVTLS